MREANSKPANKAPTSRKYNIKGGAKAIREWTKSIAKAKAMYSPDTWKIKRQCYTIHPGKLAKHANKDNELYGYFEMHRLLGRVVTVHMLCAEYKRLNGAETSAEGAIVGNGIISRRIHRWMRRKKIVNRRVTHQLQNTRHCEKVMCDWVAYVKEKIQMICIPFSNVANFDETNVDFSIPSGSALN